MKNKYINAISESIKKNFSTVKLVYQIKNEKTIKIFDSFFVNNNKNNCKMIINNKMHLLTDKYQVNDDKIKYLKIKLIIPNKIKINLSFMFYECTSLKEFHLMSEENLNFKNEYNNENKNENSQIENIKINNSFYSNNQSMKLNSSINNENKNIIITQFSNDNYSYDKKNKNNLINSSFNYLNDSLLFNSNEFEINNNNEYNSFHDFSSHFISREIKNSQYDDESNSFYRHVYSN